MTVAELERSRARRPRFSGIRRIVGRSGGSFFMLALAPIVVLAGVGGYLARSSELSSLDNRISALTTQVTANTEVTERATERVVTLSEENQRLAADLDVAQDLNADLTTRLASVEAAVQSTTDLETSLEALVAERDQLRDDLSTATGSLTVQGERLAALQPIQSFGPAGDPLLFDGSTEAWLAQPVCTGSMEPTIDCDDVLVVYRAAVTDLDVGDIIIFQRPAASCEGIVAGSYLLHRITRVVSSPTEGLMFETKGDANESVDPCLAPVTSITGKVLAIVQNSKVPGLGEH
ncbi:MAG: signal peptidase I [Chloroflexi bacterium]|nr:signal peptidase I [Chloroflexota bacterium]MDA1146709.1 signal peptidase I [Chloroflexota bacterium]